ncbi:FAR-17a/AIG1-like protein [Flammula alnicola]|nr:FAR-17a/AIG1-like protein [Flammula alnicola]
MSSLNRFYAAILHGVAANVMYQGFKSIHNLPIDEVMSKQYGGHFQYLTIQGLSLACLSMMLGMVTDLFPQLTSVKFAKRYLTIVAMPLSVVVSLIYWSLLLLFPKLIIPQVMSESSSSATAPVLFRLPLSVDLSLHAAPAVSLMLDFFLFEAKYNKRDVRVAAPIAVVAFALWYCIWVEYCGKMNKGVFPYPFLTENTQPVRIGIYIGAIILSLSSFRLINSLRR